MVSGLALKNAAKKAAAKKAAKKTAAKKAKAKPAKKSAKRDEKESGQEEGGQESSEEESREEEGGEAEEVVVKQAGKPMVMRNTLVCVAVLAACLTRLSAQPPSEAIRPFSIRIPTRR